jgi:hypothetical protein
VGHKRKSHTCLNCGQRLTDEDNYCPICGQENDNRNVSFWALVADVIEDNFGVDSRLLRSIVPFLFRPGHLTVSFLSGQRKRYVPPLRMYVVTSLVQFLLLSFLIFREDDGKGFVSGLKDGLEVKDSPGNGRSQDSTKLAAKKAKLKRLTEDTTQSISFESDNGALKIHADTDPGEFSWDEKGEFHFMNLNRADLINDSLKDRDILKKANWDTTWTNRLVVHQARKLSKDGPSQFFEYLIENASLILLIALPLCAIVLRLLYWRRRFKFIAHILHMLHLQSFSFVIFIIIGLLSWVFKDNVFLEQYKISPLLFLLILLYIYLSFKKVYGQGWIKTFVKLSIFSFFYGFNIILGILFLFVYSFLFY